MPCHFSNETRVECSASRNLFENSTQNDKVLIQWKATDVVFDEVTNFEICSLHLESIINDYSKKFTYCCNPLGTHPNSTSSTYQLKPITLRQAEMVRDGKCECVKIPLIPGRKICKTCNHKIASKVNTWAIIEDERTANLPEAATKAKKLYSDTEVVNLEFLPSHSLLELPVNLERSSNATSRKNEKDVHALTRTFSSLSTNEQSSPQMSSEEFLPSQEKKELI